jgi:hypothetical protein
MQYTTSLRPGNSLTILTMALSVFIRRTTQAKGFPSESEMRAILMIIEDIIEKQSHKVPRTVKKLVLAVALSQN